MFSIDDRPAKLCDRWTRREMLRVGGLSTLGVSLPDLLASSLAARETSPNSLPLNDKMFGRAKNVIFLYLTGGPPQHETFDPKPNAPVEIRGEYQPISTNIPGIQFCELLPRMARIASKLAVVRSMSTDDNTHSSSGSWVLTGYKYQGPNPRTIQPTDRPYFGSLIKKFKPSEELSPLSTVWIPDVNRLNENVTPAGQTGGIMGPQWDPDVFVGNPDDPQYQIEGFGMRGLPPLRLRQRRALLEQVEEHFDALAGGEAVQLYNKYQQQAFDLLTSGAAREAFAIQREPASVRERYGRNRWGQCVLLARRLIESGARLVHVQWPREPGDNAVDNPLWDTHAQNFDRVEDVLCPMFDVGFTALIEDLEQRGLLDETLVVAIGEFGRTPKINAKAGRDHWGSVFSFVMAGAGISGGQVYGASDSHGAYPAQDRVEPGHLTATIFHLLGLNYQGVYDDRLGRISRLTEKEPIFQLLGSEPATQARTVSTGDLARVPVFDPKRLITDTHFAGAEAVKHVSSPSRPKGWRAAPEVLSDLNDTFGVKLIAADDSRRVLPQQHLAIGFNLGGGKTALSIPTGTRAFVAQEVRSPFAGVYRLTAQVCADVASVEFNETVFQPNFTCRLVFFEFTATHKKATDRKELASVAFSPKLVDPESPAVAQFELTKRFANPNPGGNFSFGLGLGIAVMVEKTSQGTLELAAGQQQQAMIRIESVQLEFVGKEVNDDVTV
jgi:hypothetical protein